MVPFSDIIRLAGIGLHPLGRKTSSHRDPYTRSSETTKKSYGRPKHYENLSAGRLKFDLTKKNIN